jgi:hypothetical protein
LCRQGSYDCWWGGCTQKDEAANQEDKNQKDKTQQNYPDRNRSLKPFSAIPSSALIQFLSRHKSSSIADKYIHTTAIVRIYTSKKYSQIKV